MYLPYIYMQTECRTTNYVQYMSYHNRAPLDTGSVLLIKPVSLHKYFCPRTEFMHVFSSKMKWVMRILPVSLLVLMQGIRDMALVVELPCMPLAIQGDVTT